MAIDVVAARRLSLPLLSALVETSTAHDMSVIYVHDMFYGQAKPARLSAILSHLKRWRYIADDDLFLQEYSQAKSLMTIYSLDKFASSSFDSTIKIFRF